MDEALSREGGTKLGKVASIHHAIPLKMAMRKKRLQIKCLVALSMGAQPPEQEQSPCPGCDSTSTKYSYAISQLLDFLFSFSCLVYDYGLGYCRRFGFYFCSTAFDLLQPTEIEILKMAPGSVRKLKTKPYKSQQSVLNNASKHASMDLVTLNGVKSHFHQINTASTAGKSNSLSETQNIDHEHKEQFPAWFKKHMAQLRREEPSEANESLYSLACAPYRCVRKYTGCIVNGVRFLSKERDNRRKSQNSGIVVEGNQGDDMIEFYGVLNDIIQLDYVKDRHVTIFKCDWFDLGKRNSGIQKEGNIVSVKVTGKWYENDSYILADQARQVFYINDPKLGSEWRVVIPFQHRHIYDVDEMQDEAMDVDDDSLLEDGVYQENDIDGTFAFEVGDGDDEIQSLNREDIDPDEIESLTVSRLPQVEEVENSEDVDEEDEIDDTMVDYCSSEENSEQNSDFDMGSDDDY
ncbi:hypothetical protein DITRI_Ditri08aG0052100 [Diplodiscus trichospermus]